MPIEQSYGYAEQRCAQHGFGTEPGRVYEDAKVEWIAEEGRIILQRSAARFAYKAIGEEQTERRCEEHHRQQQHGQQIGNAARSHGAYPATRASNAFVHASRCLLMATQSG